MNFAKIKAVLLLFFITGILWAGNASSFMDIDPQTEISGNWFLGYNYDKTKNFNEYGLKRGYFTIKTKLNQIFSARYTQDITLDKEGADAGNVETRLKYLYIKAKMAQLLANSYFEFGLVHRPWLDFDGHINPYRVQGKMFAERHGIINSADFGITYAGLLGGEINSDYQKNVSDDFAGKYGSFALGIYNGGGYHAMEKNNNKTFEGRLTVRPFYQKLPGLQLSYSGAFGKANVPGNQSNFAMNLLYLSYESSNYVMTAQYYTGEGDYEGNYLDNHLNAQSNQGYSIFGEIMLFNSNFALMGRYDNFSSDANGNFENEIFIGGIAYKFLDNKVLFDYNREAMSNNKTQENFEVILEISF